MLQSAPRKTGRPRAYHRTRKGERIDGLMRLADGAPAGLRSLRSQNRMRIWRSCVGASCCSMRLAGQRPRPTKVGKMPDAVCSFSPITGEPTQSECFRSSLGLLRHWLRASVCGCSSGTPVRGARSIENTCITFAPKCSEKPRGSAATTRSPPCGRDGCVTVYAATALAPLPARSRTARSLSPVCQTASRPIQ